MNLSLKSLLLPLLAGLLAASAAFATVQVIVSTPANDATVTSPVRILASATTDAAGAEVTGWHIYVDSVSVYGTSGPTSSIDQSVTMATGDRQVIVRAWDSTGAFGSQNLTLHVTTCSSSNYQHDLDATAQWTATTSTASDGAILYSYSAPKSIVPYYSNLAAIGLTKDPAYYPQVQAWMQWYLNHLNWPDKWGLYGTVYDYNVASDGTETATGDADSTDSYAATFLSLAWAYYQTGDANAQAFIKTLDYQLDVIGGVLVQTQQSDGLTWAKPDYQIKYLMDNCEVYKGLSDLASLYQVGFNNATKSSYYSAVAAQVLQGIGTLWNAAGNDYYWYKDAAGNLGTVSWSTWYPDATSQLFPVLYGVIDPSSSRAIGLYNQLNAAFPGWTTPGFYDSGGFPWVLVADAAALQGDTGRVNTYITNVENRFVNQGFPWPWYDAEAGWFLRLNSYMLGNQPF